MVPKHFPGGEADYQTLLDMLAEDDQIGYAHWLLEEIGPDEEAVLELDSVIGRHIFAAGQIICKGSIQITGCLLAGLDIKVNYDIEAGSGIKAGGNIEAGWSIRAGKSIEAGRVIKAGESIKAGEGIAVG